MNREQNGYMDRSYTLFEENPAFETITWLLVITGCLTFWGALFWVLS